MNPGLGISLKVSSVIAFVVMAAIIKWLSAEIPTGQIMFFRASIAVLIIVAWVAKTDSINNSLRTERYGGHFLRALLGTSSMACTFAALHYLPLPDATAINYASPLLTVALGALLIGEVVRAFRWFTVVLGLVGVLIVLYPQIGHQSDTGAIIGAALALAGAILAAGAQVQIRRLIKLERSATIVFYFSINATLLALLSLPFGWVMPSGLQLLGLVSIGLLGGFGQLMLTNSYRFADAAIVAPFEYTSMLIAVGLGVWLFDDIPTLYTYVGTAIIITAGVLIIWREHYLGLERTRPRKANTPS